MFCLWLSCVVPQETSPKDDPSLYEIDESVDYAIELGEVQWVVPSESLPPEVQLQKSNNNVDIVFFDGLLFMAWRSSPTHFAGEDTQMWVVSSADMGQSWTFETEITLEADVREPRFFVWENRLHLIMFEAGVEPLAFEPLQMWRTSRSSAGIWEALEVFGPPETVPWDVDCDGFLTNDDCNDNDPAVGSPRLDQDCDGYVTEQDCNDNDPNSMGRDTDNDCDGTPSDADCDDNDPLSYTILNDFDCDGALTSVDCDDNDNLVGSRATDFDCDGYDLSTDCDDNDPDIGGTDIDGDCDGSIGSDDCDDNDPNLGSVLEDFDCDGSLTADDCDDNDPSKGDSALDTDCDGFEAVDDCDDSDSTINPSAVELCDGLDNNCDGFAGALETFTWGGMSNTAFADNAFIGNRFQATADHTLMNFSAYVSPAQGETLNWYVYESISIDGSYTLISSQSSVADNSATDWYTSPDHDLLMLDGFYYALVLEWNGTLSYYGDNISAGATTASFGELVDGVAIGSNISSSATFSSADPYAFEVTTGEEELDLDFDGSFSCEDCDDLDGNTYPGVAVNELNPAQCMTDDDGDGYGTSTPTGSAAAGSDCNDQNSSINPGQVEQLGDGIDNDCDGVAN